MKKNSLVVTGLSVWDTLGHDIHSNFQQMLTSRRALPQTPTIRNFLGFSLASGPDMTHFAEKWFAKSGPPFTQATMWVADQAVQQAGLVSDRNRVGAVASTIFNDADSIVKTATRFIKGSTRAGPDDLFFTCNDALVMTLSRIHDIRGMTWSMVASCSSAITAIEQSWAMIQQDLLDQVVVIAADYCTRPFHAFRMYGTNPYSHTNICRPFDDQRDGIVIGDGIGAMVIESEDSARQRGATVLARILGTGCATHHAHRTNPRQSQDCYGQAVDRALAAAGVSAQDIGWISAHATGTPDGDDVEAEIMGKKFPGRKITSFKGHIGHTMAASGLIELIYTIKCMEQGQIPALANTTSIGMDVDLDFATRSMTVDHRPVLKNNYGFGGRAASIVLQKS